MVAGWKFTTGFEGANFAEFDDTTSDAPALAISTDTPHSGARHLRSTWGSSDNWFAIIPFTTYAMDSATDSLHIGLSFRCSDFAEFDVFRIMVSMDGSSSDQYAGLSIAPDGGGFIGSANDQGIADDVWHAFPSGFFQVDEWYDFEMRIIFDNSAGEIQAAINGAEVVNLTGIDNFEGSGVSNQTYGSYLFWSSDTSVLGSPTVDIDDYRLGNGFSGLQGPMHHEILVPTSDVENTDPTPVGDLVNHYANIDEIPASAVDYNEFGSSGDRGLYGLSDRTLTGDVAAVNVLAAASDPGSSSVMRTIVVEGATETDGPDMVLTSTAGTRYRQGPLNTNPDTGLAWTTAEVNAMQVGARRVS